MHPRLGSATLSQLAFPMKSYPTFPWEKSQWINTVIRKKNSPSVSSSSSPRPSFPPLHFFFFSFPPLSLLLLFAVAAILVLVRLVIVAVLFLLLSSWDGPVWLLLAGLQNPRAKWIFLPLSATGFYWDTEVLWVFVVVYNVWLSLDKESFTTSHRNGTRHWETFLCMPLKDC